MEFTQEDKLLRQVVKEAWENAEFKSELMANPLTAIEKLTGAKLNLPGAKTLVVRDQTDPATIFINIPVKQTTMDDVELDETQLEAVSGGLSVAGGGFTGGGCTINPFDVIDIKEIIDPTPSPYNPSIGS